MFKPKQFPTQITTVKVQTLLTKNAPITSVFPQLPNTIKKAVKVTNTFTLASLSKGLSHSPSLLSVPGLYVDSVDMFVSHRSLATLLLFSKFHRALALVLRGSKPSILDTTTSRLHCLLKRYTDTRPISYILKYTN